jgi:hypothetical protein
MRRVLIATISMTTASGTVTYTRDLALALLRHGWLPIVYATHTGAQAELLREATIPVVTNLDSVGEVPDVIHGHHTLETLIAMTRFPDVPALFVCHDATAWHSVPPRLPRIRRFVAVDRNCRDRMVFEQGFAADDVHVLTNAVDLERFRQRPPLPAKPRRALVFSNLALESSFLGTIREACAQRGIELDVVGLASGRAVDHPETILPQYDLVFGKARCAIEAMAVGAAVVVCDGPGMAGLVTTSLLEEMRVLNFGRRTLQRPYTLENVLCEIDRYDPDDAAEVSARIRASNDIDLLAEQFIALYDGLLADPVRSGGADEMTALSASLERLTHHLYAQTEGAASRIRELSAVLQAKPFGPLLRVAWRLKKRLRL